MKAFYIMTLSLLITACSTMEHSLGLGAAIGGSIGGAIGNANGEGNQRDKQTIQGVAIGAAVGGLIGYLAFKDKKKEVPKAENVGLEPKAPSLTAPKVRRVWVGPSIEGERYIDGHYIYVIEKTSAWSQ